MFTSLCQRFASAGVLLALLLLHQPPLARAVEASARDPPSIFVPPLSRGVTRIAGTLRPFVITPGPGFGMISDLTIEHYFKVPVKLGVDLLPLALVAGRDT